MKKVYLFSVMALCAATVGAQSVMMDGGQALELKTIPVKGVTVAPSVFKMSSDVTAPVMKAPSIVYGCAVSGNLNAGTSEDLRLYSASIAVAPAGKKSAFYVNDTLPQGVTANYEWTIAGADGTSVPMEIAENGRIAYAKTWGATYFPVVGGTTSDGGTIGYDKSKDPANQADNTLFAAQFNRTFPVTMSDPSFVGGQLYGGFNDGQGGTLNFGTGMTSSEGEVLTGVFALHTPLPSPMLVYGGTVVVSAAVDGKDIIPAGKSVLVEIWTVGEDEEGKLKMVEKLGETTSASDQLLSQGALSALKFTFQVPNELGIYVPTPVTVPAGTNYAIFIKNMKELNMNILFTAPSIIKQGSAYISYDDEYTKFGSITFSTGRVAGDMCINLDCDMPALEWDAERMDFPTEGGVGTTVANFIDQQGNPIEQNIEWGFLMTSMPYLVNPDMGDMSAKNFTFEAPEWIKSIQVAEYKEGDYGWDDLHMYAVSAEAEALPAGETGRSGILMCTGPCGLKYGIKIGQGEWNPENIENSIESVAAPKASVAVAGDNLMLTYGEEYNTVTVYNVAGSEVASYALPQGGSFEVPAAALNGVYMVVFEGASREVVKVVK